MKNLFITFEGIEGCGKSTQAKLLEKYLIEKGHQVLLTREPGGPAISEKIRNILLDNDNAEMTPQVELLLFLAARNQHTIQWIKPALEKGTLVISDRYADSTLAYQGAARHIDIQTTKQLNNFATSGLTPDITFIIDIPVEILPQRLSGKKLDRLEQESKEFHKEVRNAFCNLCSSQTAEQTQTYYLIDGTQTIDEIHNQIVEIINNATLRI